MVECDARDHARLGRLDHIRRVEPSAQTHFHNRDIAAYPCKVHERDGAGKLEFGWMIVHGFRLIAHRNRSCKKVIGRNTCAVDGDAVLVRPDRRTRKHADAQSGSLQHACGKRGHRALAVRTRNVHDAVRSLGMVEPFDELGDTAKPQLARTPCGVFEIRYWVERHSHPHFTFARCSENTMNAMSGNPMIDTKSA